MTFPLLRWPGAALVAISCMVTGCGSAARSSTAPVVTATTTTAPTASAVPAGVATSLGPWRLVGRTEVVGAWSDQGLATVGGPGAVAATVYRGTLSVTAPLRAQGWTHIGDPDSWDGWIVDPFQGASGASSKMFRVTSPAGIATEVVHPLAAGESSSNSFAAISPDGRWLVTGEWGTVRRLLVLDAPLGSGPAPLGLAATVALTGDVRDVQGCAFAAPTRLVCVTSDPGTDLWPAPDQVLQVDLRRPLSAAGPSVAGASVTGMVTYLGPVPRASACPGTYEPEGVDVDRVTATLRIEVVPPGGCALFTQVYSYRSS